MKVCEPIYYTQSEANAMLEESGKSNIKVCSDVNMVSKKMEFYCDIHNYKWTSTFYKVLHEKYGCKYCCNDGKTKTRLSKYNLWDIRPDVAQLLENPDDAINCSEHCKDKKWFICPNCNARLYKAVYNVSDNGLKCNLCSDGFSYPNKVMYNVLKQLNIEFISEYSPDWISPKRYDFYFEMLNNKYIIEMDGGLGHGKKMFSNDTATIEDSILNDKYKDLIAIEHNIQVIRINCDESNISYIKNEIIKSDLSNIIALDKIDWEKCDYNTRKSMIIKACELYNQYPFLSYKELANRLHLSEDTIRKYLKIGFKQKLCPQYKRSGENHIICIDSNIIFRNAKEAGDYYNIDPKRITNCCKNIFNHACSLNFQYLKDYKGDIDNLVPDYNVKSKRMSEKRLINAYDKRFNYIATYDSVTSAADQNKKNLKSYNKIL